MAKAGENWKCPAIYVRVAIRIAALAAPLHASLH
jgi:hypothetical protein